MSGLQKLIEWIDDTNAFSEDTSERNKATIRFKAWQLLQEEKPNLFSEKQPEEGQKVICFKDIGKEGLPAVFERNQFSRYPNQVFGDRCAAYYYRDIKYWLPFPTCSLIS